MVILNDKTLKKKPINFNNLIYKIMKKMKKNLAILMFITFTTAFAQETKEKEFNKDKTGKNEFRIGAIHVLFLSLNANYERILDKYSGFGVTLNIYNNETWFFF